jgi:hypothetical protein
MDALNRSNVLEPSVFFLPRKGVKSDPSAIAAEGSVTLVDQDQSYVLLEAAPQQDDGYSDGYTPFSEEYLRIRDSGAERPFLEGPDGDMTLPLPVAPFPLRWRADMPRSRWRDGVGGSAWDGGPIEPGEVSDEVLVNDARWHLERWGERERAAADAPEAQGGSSEGPGADGLVNGRISARGSQTEQDEGLYRTKPHPEEDTPVAVATAKPGGVSVGKQDKTAVRKPPQVKRDVITGRSSESRRRLMENLSAIDMSAFASERKDARFCRSAFVTLTYPADFPGRWENEEDLEGWEPGWKAAKAHLRAWKERLGRHEDFAFSWAAWVEEYQARGAVHFHVILVFKNPVDLKSFRPWLSEAWYEIVDSEDPKHLKAGTQAVAVHLSQGVGSLMGYLAGEMGKIKQTRPVDPRTGELIPTGRTWGFWGKDAIPFETLATISFWTWEAWSEFKRRVSKHFEKSRYLSLVAGYRSWAGALLYGDGGELLKILIQGIPGVEIRTPGRVDMRIEVPA